ncbi:SusC/RagA family TonB-linked outer membrane protein [Parabacteroides goldsteinii dnLKV18]|uniref:SusC/RagA family TonB-linked outer membrane protein n=1 Tax=Parabacteroides goldsteinii dnLKV18 TaxID=1235789 RepID=S0GU78_9BACT|nr:SusC/RagA family TonB-linked outer membrane protein [Parabacteroides goldsteinii dnLKV18]
MLQSYKKALPGINIPQKTQNRIFVVMRFSILFFFLSIWGATAASSYSQVTKLNLDMNGTVLEVIKAIESQSEFTFVYKQNEINLDEKVSIDLENKTISEILDVLLRNKSLGYEIMDRHIALFKKTGIQQDSKKVVTGRIIDDFGEPVIGANVLVKNEEGVGTTTDMDGKFTLDLEGYKDPVLVISFIGYSSQEVVVGKKRTLNITLKEDSKALEEVIVVGYGKNSKRNLTSAVSTVNTDKIKNVPVANVTDALAGRAAGLIVTSSGGGLNKTSTVSIRGGGQPIVVIDGFVSDYNDFVNLNSDDIESMSVLKDAAAAAVYGARAGNGVLVVKTKNGLKGLRVDYSFNQNWSEPTYLEKKLNSYECAVFDNTVRDLYDLEPRWTEEEVEKYRTGSDPYNYPNTDWQKVMLRNFTPETKHSLAVRGGSDFNKYYISFQAYNQRSMYKADTEWYKRYNVRMNDVSEFKDLGLKLTFGLDGYISTMRSPRSQYSSGYWQTWGHIQNNGPMSLPYNQDGLPYVGADNPVVEVSPESGYMKFDNKMITGLFNAEWNVYGVEGLKLKVGGNYRYGMYDGKTWNKTAPQYDLEGNKGPEFPVSLNYSSNYARMWTTQYFADYNRSFLDETHNVSATLGYEQSYSFYRGFDATRKNYIFMIDQMGAGPSDSMENGGSEEESGRAGLVARASYNYKKKYYIEGSLRHDGSDLFPKDRRWGNFFAGSAAWAVSEESFFQPLKERNILNFFKLRASYGQVGMDNISRFSYLTSYGLNERGYVLDGKIVPTFSEGGLISDDITWYTSNSLDLGFDFNTLGERLAGSFDYFYMKTTGYLTSPSNVGYTDPLGLSLPKVKSDGEHRRAGYEFNLSWKDHFGDFNYEVGANFTYFDQLVATAWEEDLADQKNPYKRTTQQTGYWGVGYTNLGFYQNSDQALNLPRRDGSSNLVAGDIIYKDMNGDGFIDGADQWRIGKNSFPRGNYGIYANLSYKGFSANILFQGATSRDMYIEDVVRGQSTGGYSVVYPYQLDYWMPDNRDALYPRIAMNSNVNGNNNYVQSDFWLVNGRYIRLKSLQVGYDFRTVLLKNVKWLYKCQVMLSGQNLFTISPATKYGFDPENGSTNNYDYPMQRVYSISLNLGF